MKLDVDAANQMRTRDNNQHRTRKSRQLRHDDNGNLLRDADGNALDADGNVVRLDTHGSPIDGAAEHQRRSRGRVGSRDSGDGSNNSTSHSGR